MERRYTPEETQLPDQVRAGDVMRERTIAGGSSEVQHNVIARAILGL